MPVWNELPLDQGVVNSRPPSMLQRGELAQASGVVYKRGSTQLHPAPAWSSFSSQPLGSTHTGEDGTAYTITADKLNKCYKGYKFLTFENGANCHILVVPRLNENTAGFGGTYAGAEIWWLVDGTSTWKRDEFELRDNETRQADGLLDETVVCSITHWGDSYWLTSNHGNCVITPNADDIPTVKRMGMHYREGFGMANLGFAGDEALLGETAGSTVIEWQDGVVGRPDVDGGDFANYDQFIVLLTEVNSETGEESLPTWYGGPSAIADSTAVLKGYAGSVNSQRVGKAFKINFPTNLVNDGYADKFRCYLKFLGNAGSNSGDEPFNAIIPDILDYTQAVIGTNLLSKDSQYEFDPGDSIVFDAFSKNSANNPIPVVPVDNAKFIYWRNRRPRPASVSTIWNDSLVTNDSGSGRIGIFESSADDDDSIIKTYFGQYDAIPTVSRYSFPGDLQAQPVGYFMNFATQFGDAVRGFVPANNRLVALCESSVHTISYMPFNGLVPNQQGRVKNAIVEGRGCVGFSAFTKISTTSGEFVVWLSQDGLNWTNGSGWQDACPDFRIEDDVTDDQLSRALLANDAENDRLYLWVGNYEYIFHYSQDHLKNGRLKMTGPNSVSGSSHGATFYLSRGFRMIGNVLYTMDPDAPRLGATVVTGHIRSDQISSNIEVTRAALQKTGHDVQHYLSVSGAIPGYEAKASNVAAVPNNGFEEVSQVEAVNRGEYVFFTLTSDPSNADWGAGPIHFAGNLAKVH